MNDSGMTLVIDRGNSHKGHTSAHPLISYQISQHEASSRA